MSHSISLRALVDVLPFPDKGKEEDDVINGEETQAPIDLLPNDLLSLVFDYATGGCTEGKTCSAIRAVNWNWASVLDTCNLRSNWGSLQKEIKSPSLRDLVGQIVFVDRFVSEAIASAIDSGYAEANSSDQAFLLDRIEYMGPSWFSRFSQLTQKLREKGTPILHEHAVIGLERSSYEDMQQRLDTALETIWKRINRQIDFEGVPVPSHAEAIRAWLNNPIHADKIARIIDLDLSGMHLMVLPCEIGKFSQLTGLNLCQNRLRTLPFEIGNLVELTGIGLAENQFTTIPHEIGSFTQLTELFLNRNKIASVPAAIGKLSQLRSLDLSENQIASLPSEIGNLSELRELQLAANQLTSLPFEMGNLSQLMRFSHSNNKLTSLPLAMANIPQLIIDYSYPDFEVLPFV